MKVTEIDESVLGEIGHAFAYYDYGGEYDMTKAFPSREAVAFFIGGYAKMAMQSGMLYTTSERQEGFAAYKLPGERVRLRAALTLASAMLHAMSLGELIRCLRTMSGGGAGEAKKYDREKKPYIFVGLVCVREKYQGQGYMRRVMDMAFEEGNRLGVPVILETDAKSKCDKYVHLGMTLVGTRAFGEEGTLYDLVKYPDKE